MTVAELMAALMKMPEDAIVVQRGYESGMIDVRSAHFRRIFLRKPPIEWWDGTYQSYYDSSEGEVLAVVLGEAGG